MMAREFERKSFLKVVLFAAIGAETLRVLSVASK